MFGDYITIGQAVIVCVFSLIVVFAVLLIQSYVIDLTAWIIQRFSKKKAQAPAAQAAPASVDDSTDAVLAAAAIAAYLGKSTDEFVVRSIRRVSGSETPWTQAGRTSSLQ